MHDFDLLPLDLTRRAFLGRTTGLGAVALASLLNPSLLAADANGGNGSSTADERWRGVVNPLHFRQRAKRVIFLYMAGGPSHLETLDYKPKLAQLSGEPMPESITKGQPIAQLQGKPLNCYAPQHPFAKYGRSGQQISTLFPNVGKIADEICIIRSMHTEAINHDPAHTFMNTGTTISGRPSMGSWLLYGLGSDADDLPGFVVMTSSGKFGQMQPLSARMWHSGFLPSKFQGVEFRSKGDPVLYVSNPTGVTRERQQDVVAATEALNRMHNDAVDDPEILTRIAQYEMAFKMQLSIPQLMDISDESPETLELYGTKGADGSFAANCLLARRLAERGVRFIQLYHRDWDHHNGIKTQIAGVSGEVDRPTYALITDLKRRGMLDETLVVWGGEFGRTPMAQGDGRDHHIKGYSLWMAGGGIKGGISYGATDEFGYNAVENPVHVNDFHATMLYLLGIDHTRLTYRYQGRDFRLTDVAGKVVEPILV
jgi:hypothetical protein